MASIFDYYLKGKEDRLNQDRFKVINNYKNLAMLGAAPTATDAMSMKDLLGINWPQDETGKYKSVPLGNRSTGSLSTDNLKAQLLAIQATGGQLTPEQTGVLSTLNSEKTPWGYNQLPPDKQMDAVGISLKVQPDANKLATEQGLMARFETGQAFKEKSLQYKKEAEARLDADRDAKRISDIDYQRARIALDAKHKAFTGDMIMKIMKGEDMDNINFEDFYGVNFNPQSSDYSPEDFITNIALQAKDMDTQAKKEFIQNKLREIAVQIANQL